jgi:uncharacterized protein (DUF2267 family)
MTIPLEIQRATADFDTFLAHAQERAGLATRNQTYTMVEGVLRVFRRRLDVKMALAFADVLPPVLRAIFVADWDLDEPTLSFADRVVLTREVQTLRKHHNFAPDTAIADVAAALRRHVDEAAFERAFRHLPQEAKEFWAPPGR